MNYLADDEILEYCTIIPDITPSIVKIATELINGYLGFSLAPLQHKESINLNKNGRGKLRVTPIISIDTVKERIVSPYFGMSNEEVSPDSVILDVEGDGYFSYFANGINSTLYKTRPGSLEVTYTAGYTVIPEDIKIVCAMLAQHIKQRSSFGNEKAISTLDYRMELSDPSFLTPDMRMILDRYK